MNHIMRIALLVLLAALHHTAAAQETTDSGADTSQMSPELLWKLGRLGEAAVSPDGTHVAYTVRRYVIADNKGKSTLFLMKLADGSVKPMLESWSSIGSIQWIGEGADAKLFFEGMEGKDDEEESEDEDKEESDEEESEDDGDHSDAPQAHCLNVTSGDLTVVSNLEDGISNLKVSPTGKHIAYTQDIKMDDTVNELYEDLPEADARIIDGLMYRHWNAWHDYKYTHLHVAPLANGEAGEGKDLMDGMKVDCPVPPFGGSEQFNWSPDGKEIAYTIKDVAKWAESTDSNVWTVNIETGEKKNVSENMPGYDRDPVYSPDGKWLSFQSMERASFESDRNRIMLVERSSGTMKELTIGLDQNANGIHWTSDSQKIAFSSEYRGTDQMFEIGLESPGTKRQVTKGQFNWHVVDFLPDGKSAIATRMNMIRPNELTMLDMESGDDKVLTHINDEIYKGLEVATIEERFVTATDGQKIHCWVAYLSLIHI